MNELGTVLNKYSVQADANWSAMRYNYIFPTFQSAVVSHTDVDFEGFYVEYQSKFNNFVQNTLDEVRLHILIDLDYLHTRLEA